MSIRRVSKARFLDVYDALKRLDPRGTIVAHAENRRPYQVDMVWQVPNYTLDNFEEMSTRVQDVLPLSAITNASGTLNINFQGSREVLHLNIGINVESPDIVNQLPDNESRRLIRCSLGADEGDLLKDLPSHALRAAKMLVDRAKTEVTGVQTPDLYWVAHVFHYVAATNDASPSSIARNVWMRFPQYYGKQPLTNPSCIEEDLNTLDAAKQLNEPRMTNL